MICAIHARHVELNRRLGSARLQLHKSLVYTSNVRQRLSQCGFDVEAAGLSENSSPHDWRQGLDHIHGHTVGVAWLVPSSSPVVQDFLNSAERSVYDFWLHTHYAEEPLVSSTFRSFVVLRGRSLYMA